MIEGARWRRWVFFYVPVTAFVVFLLFPFYWMVITTLRPDRELYRPWSAPNYAPFWTSNPTLEHITDLLSETLFSTWMLNTMFISLAATAISLFCGLLAGYALSRLKFPFAGALGTGIFITYLVPQTLLFIPLADIIRNFRLGDAPWALILTYPTFLIPFCTWLMMGYFKSIPKELEECARIDGAPRWKAMVYIIFPAAIPGILSAGIFAFTLSRDEFIYALGFLSSPEEKTVPVGVTSELIRGDVFFWGQLMAGALLGSIPVAIVYSFFVEYYVSGITGSVKGGSDMARVAMRSLNKMYDEVHAVKDVNLDIRDKEFVVLVGPSGCGKTTTLRMVAGLESITSGRILIDDKVINELAPMDRDIAMVFQNYALYPHMSVYDNMAFGLKMRKFDRADIARRVREAADILGIRDLLQRKPRQLSGGQRQRVALGRAIVRHPQVFLFDEPLSNLDAKLRVQMRVELKKLHDRLGTTAIYVTHDQVEAMTLGDRVVVMKDGFVQQVGEPLELYNEPANRFVAGFIGSPAMNFLTVRVNRDNGAIWAANAGMQIKAPPEYANRLGRYVGQEVTLGIRPEDLHVASAADPTELGFDVVIEVVEKLGSEILLDVAAGPDTMVASVEPNVRVNVHDRLRLAANPEGLHFFDSLSEAVI